MIVDDQFDLHYHFQSKDIAMVTSFGGQISELALHHLHLLHRHCKMDWCITMPKSALKLVVTPLHLVKIW